MKSPEEASKPDRSPSDPRLEEGDQQELAREIEQVERSLLALKERYAQVQRDRDRQKELQHRLEDVRGDMRRNRSPQLLAELQQIKQQLETLEVSLESSLFSFSSLKEPFWQAVRFAGIGIAIGWLLKSCAG